MDTLYGKRKETKYKYLGQIKKDGGGNQTTTVPLGGQNERKRGGVGVTLSAVSSGQSLIFNTVPISKNSPFLRSFGFAIGVVSLVLP